MAIVIEDRKYLVDALNEALPRLYKAGAHAGREIRAGVFLQQAIARYADEETLRRILGDVWQQTVELEGAIPVR